MEFNNEELKLIKEVFSQVSWKIGSSNKLLLSESIDKKCNQKIIPETPTPTPTQTQRII